MRTTRVHGQRGAAAVEFAIVLLPLVLILFGIVEFSLIMYDKAQITNASREGARFGAAFHPDPRPTCQEIFTAAIAPYQQGLVTFGGTTTIAPTCRTRAYDAATGTWSAWGTGVCAEPNDQIAVDTSFTYTFLVFPKIAQNFLGALTLTSTTVMRCE